MADDTFDAVGVAAAAVAGFSPDRLRDLSEAADGSDAAGGVAAVVVAGFSPVFPRVRSQGCLLMAVDVFDAAGVDAAAVPETVEAADKPEAADKSMLLEFDGLFLSEAADKLAAAAGVDAAVMSGFSPMFSRV